MVELSEERIIRSHLQKEKAGKLERMRRQNRSPARGKLFLRDPA